MPVGVGRSGMLSVVGVKKGKVFGEGSKHLALLFAVRFDDKGAISWRGTILFRLAVDETEHVWHVFMGRLPLLVNLVGDASKVVIRVRQGNLFFVRSSANGYRFIPHSPVWVGVVAAVAYVLKAVRA